METSKGRTCNFGPHIDFAIWTLKPLVVAPKHGRILGLYYDALRLRSGHITSFGFSCRTSQAEEIGDESQQRQSPLHPYHNINTYSRTRLYPNLSGWPLAIFSSQAALSSVDVIKVCYVSNRCTGMLIHYANCSVETLGQWFESTRGRHDIIYDIRRDGMFDKLRFRLCGMGNLAVVENVWTVLTSRDISCCSDDTAVVVDVNCNASLTLLFMHSRANITQDILMWWFSEHSDVILSEHSLSLSTTGD